MTNTYFFNLNKTLFLSAILHVGAFAAAILLSTGLVKPLPVGVELAYDSFAKVSKAAPAFAPHTIAKQIATPEVASKNNFVGETVAKSVTASADAVSANPSTVAVAVTGREGVANGTEVSSEERYLYELKKLLERRKNYPMMARKMGHAGTVTMRFTLRADGSVSESEVVEKAPYETLNQAAVTLVNSINGVKPFPNDIHRDTWSITVPIEYKLN